MWEFSVALTYAADGLWEHFGPTDRPSPPVYWSPRLSRTIHARTYPVGIIVSRKAYHRVHRHRRGRWLRGLLLHELLHWAGYRHDAAFRRYCRQLGTY